MNLEEAIKFCEEQQLNINFTCSMNKKNYVKVSANGWYEEIGDTLIEVVEKFKCGYGPKTSNQVKQKL